MRFADSERERLEQALKASDEERRRLAPLASELPAEARRRDESVREVSRLRSRIDELEDTATSLRRAVRAAEQRTADVERESDVSARAALTAVEEEQRLRLAEADEASRRLAASQADATSQIEELQAQLKKERARRQEAAQAAIAAETLQHTAVAEEARRRLQMENAARLERTARRDLLEERELIRSLLGTNDKDGSGREAHFRGASRSRGGDSASEPEGMPTAVPVAPPPSDVGDDPAEVALLRGSLPTPTISGHEAPWTRGALTATTSAAPPTAARDAFTSVHCIPTVPIVESERESPLLSVASHFLPPHESSEIPGVDDEGPSELPSSSRLQACRHQEMLGPHHPVTPPVA